MGDYLAQYCQLSEETVYQYCNIPHEKIKNFITDNRISRFPMHYFQQELVQLGLILLVQDRSGKKLPYINPILLSCMSKKEILKTLLQGSDCKSVLENLLWNLQTKVVPVPLDPVYPSTTHKKSFQKKIDKKRRKREDLYDEYKRR